MSVIVPFSSSTYSQTTGWLTGWQYRKSHTIESSVGTGTNYQVRITVHRSVDTDTGEHVYIGTKCRTDFGDIRFTDDDGTKELDYWVETIDSNKALFWVEVSDDLSENPTLIYIYYGNSSATTMSNGPDTFLWFIDQNNVSGWDIHGMTISSEGGYLRFYNDALLEGGYVTRPLNPSTTIFALEMQFHTVSLGTNDQFIYGLFGDIDTLRMSQLAMPSVYSQTEARYFLVLDQYTFYDELSEGTSYILRNYCNESSSTANHYYIDDQLRNNLGSALDIQKAQNSPDEVTRLLIGDGTANGYLDLRLKWLFLRSWTGDIEPIQGAWGAEASSTTSSPPDGSGGIDMMILIIVGGGSIGIVIILATIVLLLKRRTGGTAESGQVPYNW
ncbi:MAG: DUF2341 domain-containing protein [Candidatus Thorarchaeota archaeon]